MTYTSQSCETKIEDYETELDTNEDNENFESFNLNLTLCAEEECLLTPSSLLSNNEWVHRTRDCFDIREEDIINENTLTRVNLLYKKLLERLIRHKRQRIEDEQKRDHRCMKLTARNMAQLVLMMVLSCHVMSKMT